MQIIGLMGKAFSGKSSAARYLVEGHNFTRLSFGEPIKLLAIKYFGLTPEEVFETKPPHVRTILQGLGTLVRKEINDFYLVFKMSESLRSYKPKRAVIDDVRMPEEADLIKMLGGTVVRLEYQDSSHKLEGEQSRHITETAMDGIPHDIAITAKSGDLDTVRMVLDDVVRGMEER